MGYPWREGIVGKKQTAGVTHKWEMKQTPGVPRSLGVERGKSRQGKGLFFLYRFVFWLGRLDNIWRLRRKS